MPSTNYACVNGRFVPADRASVPITDRGYLYGDGVFETMRIYAGQIFRVSEHLQRLSAGAEFLGFTAIFSMQELRAVCRVLIQRNQVTSGVARIYLTRDSLLVTVRPGNFEPRTLTALVSAVRVDPQWSQYKTANRLPYIMAHRQAAAEGADEALLLSPQGSVAEFSASNVFVLKDGELWTPPLADGPLPGVARRAVIELANDLDLPVHEESFAPEFLDTADEVFATNSLMEIAPVQSWGNSNRLTARLQTAYRQLVQEELGARGPS